MLVPRAGSPLHHQTALTRRAAPDHFQWKRAADSPQNEVDVCIGLTDRA